MEHGVALLSLFGALDMFAIDAFEAKLKSVEVKARRGDRFGGPVEAVNWRKQKELGRSARVWVSRHGRSDDAAYRFDVVGVLVDGQRVRIRHIEGAFSLHLSA